MKRKEIDKLIGAVQRDGLRGFPQPGEGPQDEPPGPRPGTACR